MRLFTSIFGLWLVLAVGFPSRGQDDSPAKTIHCVTNVSQFKALTGTEFLEKCDFHLSGTITLVDTNRDLVVLQDATGAVALNFSTKNQPLQVGQSVTVNGTNCCPFFARFPNFPHRPSGREICTSFEAPANWGEYNLTRVRGWLHPLFTGDYRFWIASDDSSELWLSTDANPANARKIASVPRFKWTDPHQWSKYPSQRSDLIQLKAGMSYYIEAIQEQATADEHLSVAWQEPVEEKTDPQVIDGHYLTPWKETGEITNGILREYWTNYFCSESENLAGGRPYLSALTAEQMSFTIQGPGTFPKPESIIWNQPLTTDTDYHWVSARGMLKFKAMEGNMAALEIFDGQASIPVRVRDWNTQELDALAQLTNPIVEVEGVCEGVDNQLGAIMPSCLWVPDGKRISFSEAGATNPFTAPESPLPIKTANTVIPGYFGTRGVVTFNDRVLDTDYILVQAENSAWAIALTNGPLKDQLKPGHFVDLGGSLQPARYLQTITPLFIIELGLQPMPPPVIPSLATENLDKLEGKWCQLEGVVRAANSNGMLRVMTKDGPAGFWVGQIPPNDLSQYVDAKIRARGVLMPNLLGTPSLLVPSRAFLDMVTEAPQNPFAIKLRTIASLLSQSNLVAGEHRTRVSGEITYRDEHSFFIQDASGGIRVQLTRPPTEQVGDSVEVIAFPAMIHSTRILTEPVLRSAKPIESIQAKNLNLNDALAARQNGNLVHVSATLLSQKTNGRLQVLELQEEQRVFAALLTAQPGDLPALLPGSRLRITGVCDDEITAATASENAAKPQFFSSLNLLLRSPQDVTLISGPPWWTWEKTATLVGTLLAVLAGTLLWVHLLHRRLERQAAAQIAFSRRVLERLEEERRRIAVNLHDSLGQSLLVIKNHAILASQPPAEEAGVQSRLNEISGTTSQAIEEVRRITHGLRPYQLDRLGLTHAIRSTVNNASKNGAIVFASRVEDIDKLFDKDAEIHVYRIMQEAITNVVKHSCATEATVVVKKKPAVVSLSIRDNGKGFDPGRPSSQLHDLGYGLTGISERVRILNGTVQIDSHPGTGTSLMVEVPF